MIKDIFAAIKELTVRGMSFGTERTRAILNALGSPDKKLKIIHVAGTNGKGSTAEFFTQILISAKKRVGTFTSPEVYSYFDQFRIDGKPIEKEKLAQSFKRAYDEGQKLGATAFEIETAGVISAFAENGCEYAVIECGMGGLNDATNAVENKALAVITSISLEHTAYLGGTVEEICAHKAGVIKNCPAVGNPRQTEEAKRFLKSRGVEFANGITYCGGNVFWYYGKEYELSAQGCAQPYNAATAIAGARILGVDEKAIYEGVKNTKPRGRLEKFEKGWRTYILDGAHNPDAFVPLVGLLKQYKDGLTLIFGCLSDKDIDANLKALADTTQNIIAVECRSPRATPLEKTEIFCRKYFKNVSAAGSVSDALNSARTKTVAVCGSFTLLTEAKQWIENLTEKGQ